MDMTFTRYALALAPACLILLAACGQQPESSKTSSSEQVASASQTDPCAANAQVAVDFVNLYVKHLRGNEAAAEPTDTYEWLTSSSLVDPAVASAYAATDLIDGDPILDAQDYPNTFAFANCSGGAGLVEVKGVGEPAISVHVKVSDVSGRLKVVGVGRLNMPEAAAESGANSETTQASSSSSRPKWIEGFGQGNLEYFIDHEGFRLYIGCPTQGGSADARSSVELVRTSDDTRIAAFTIEVDGMTFEGPFEADSRVGDNNFVALLEALHATDATVKFQGKSVTFPKSNAAEVVPTHGSPNFSCNLS